MSARPDARPPGRPRRSPTPDERQRDAGRTRQLIIDAARTEFAARGFAGARVGDIADRAGVNKQLITYYFGGKEGLYRTILEQWREVETRHRRTAEGLEGLVVAYLRANHEQPELARILMWEGLAAAASREPPALQTPPEVDDDLADMHRRQASGELDASFDAGHVLLALMGAVAAPTILAHVARRLTGLQPNSDQFVNAYAEQLSEIVRRLRAPGSTDLT